jgi:uncharacterized protein (TIGR00369 family)
MDQNSPRLEELHSCSGLEFMQRIVSSDGPHGTIISTLGCKITAVHIGKCEIRGTADASCANLFGGTHGGWYGMVLDSAMACSVMTMLPQGRTYTTLEYKVNITRGLKIGTPIIATGDAQHVGRSTGVARGEIRGLDGVLYATGSTTCLIMDKRP